jgi:hypothetical protein
MKSYIQKEREELYLETNPNDSTQQVLVELLVQEIFHPGKDFLSDGDVGYDASVEERVAEVNFLDVATFDTTEEPKWFTEDRYKHYLHLY